MVFTFLLLLKRGGHVPLLAKGSGVTELYSVNGSERACVIDLSLNQSINLLMALKREEQRAVH
jgi:hypothetical protein